jgi:tellurite resistance protein
MAQPWLYRLHPGLFGMCLGLLSLSLTWRKYAQIDASLAQNFETFFLILGVGLLCTLTLLWIVKALVFPKAIKEQFLHPVFGAMMAYFSISTMLAIALICPRFPELQILFYGLAALAMTIQLSVAARVVSLLATGEMPSEHVTPALYLPIVPGGLVGAVALANMGLMGLAELVWGMGLGGVGVVRSSNSSPPVLWPIATSLSKHHWH